MIDISVIIPLFKGEKYLNYWIDILEKNFIKYQEKYNLECEAVFVNDYPGEKILLRDNRPYFTVYNLKKNQGVHGARVFGYYKAKGNYIVFVDQDDKITEDYLISQKHEIGEASAVVCNGYKQRLWMHGKRLIYADNVQQKSIEEPVNDFSQENEILSPGQVLIKKKAIPTLWLKEIMKENGADDYFLWILMKRKGCIFNTNPAILYTHIDYGTNTSNDSAKMNKSVLEMITLLERNNILEEERIESLRKKECYFDAMARRHINMFKVYDYWLCLSIRNVRIETYFYKRNYKSIAVYGINFFGNRLCDALSFSSVSVVFGIDRMAKSMEYDIPIFNLEDSELLKCFDKIDVIVVTAINAYKNVREDLKRLCDKPIISLEKICLELLLEEGLIKYE